MAFGQVDPDEHDRHRMDDTDQELEHLFHGRAIVPFGRTRTGRAVASARYSRSSAGAGARVHDVLRRTIQTMATLTAWKFSTPGGADAALNTLQQLQSQELIQLLDGAVVTWPTGDKKPKTRQ